MSKTDPSVPVRILFAEDDDDDFLLLEEALSEAGIANEYQRVKDGSELLSHLKTSTEPVDVILLDLNMSPMGGLEALSLIRADPQLRELDVVVLTTSLTEEERCRRLGVKDYHVKPVEHEDFIEIFKNVLGYYFHPNPAAT